jgi:hypothetical protein
MNRREALVLMAAGFGGTIFGAQRMLLGIAEAAEPEPRALLSPSQLALLNEVGETILPATAGSGGAKAANVAAFLEDTVRNFYAEGERATFVADLALLQAASRGRYSGRGFLDLAPGERFDLVQALDQGHPQPPYYQMIKQLSLMGYFTSEIGATQAMAHVAVPGRFDGVVKIPPGTRAWSY